MNNVVYAGKSLLHILSAVKPDKQSNPKIWFCDGEITADCASVAVLRLRTNDFVGKRIVFFNDVAKMCGSIPTDINYSGAFKPPEVKASLPHQVYVLAPALSDILEGLCGNAYDIVDLSKRFGGAGSYAKPHLVSVAKALEEIDGVVAVSYDGSASPLKLEFSEPWHGEYWLAPMKDEGSFEI